MADGSEARTRVVHPSRVIVAVDFSDSARRALDVGAVVAKRARVPLEIVHAIGGSLVQGATTESLARLRDDAARGLGEWETLARESGAEVTSCIVEGVPSRSIAQLAESRSGALVVVGRRGQARLSHVLMGSVAERVVHQGTSPVLVVPLQGEARTRPDRLLVGVDFSRSARAALRLAVALAERLACREGLVVAHVTDGEQDRWLESWSELARRDRDPIGPATVRDWARGDWPSDVPMEARVFTGRPEPALIEAARSTNSDWIVLGLHGRTALGTLLAGSTTDRVLKLADRPVLVVPGSGASSREPAG